MKRLGGIDGVLQRGNTFAVLFQRLGLLLEGLGNCAVASLRIVYRAFQFADVRSRLALAILGQIVQQRRQPRT